MSKARDKCDHMHETFHSYGFNNIPVLDFCESC